MILEPSSCPKTPFCVSKLPRSYFQQAERIDRTQLTSCFLQEIRAPMLKRTNAKAAVAATLVFINASVLLKGTTTIARRWNVCRRYAPVYFSEQRILGGRGSLYNHQKVVGWGSRILSILAQKPDHNPDLATLSR